MKIFCTIFLILGSLLFQDVKADELKVEKVEIGDGLPSNLVYKIYQDSKGFIWFGTMYGLYRYDGVNYNSYRYDPFDSTSIGNDDVISIFEDSKGYLWFGTYLGGVSRYNAKTSSFSRFIHKENSNSICDNTVWSITEDKSGVLWFGTQNGLSKYENNIFTTYRNFNGNEKSNYILSLTTDNDNNLWIGSYMGGLFRLNPDRTTFDNFKRNNDPDSLNGNVVRGLYCDKWGNLWAGMIQRGVCMIKAEDIKRGEFRFNKQLFDSTKDNAPGNATVYDISEDKSGNIYFSSSNYIYKYVPEHSAFSKSFLSKNIKSPSESVAMICDISNCIWISSYENCLYKAVNNNESFSNFTETADGVNIGSVKSIFYDSHTDKYLLGSSSGLFELDEAGNKIKQVNLKLPVLSVNTIAEDIENNMVLGTDNGLLIISGAGEGKNILQGTTVTKLLTDGNNIVTGTINGLYFVNSIKGDTTGYRNIQGDINSLSDNAILSLYKDKENNIWAGTYGGLNKFNRDKNNFERYSKNLNDTNSLSNNYVYSIAQRDENSLYLGTAGGLNIFNSKTGTVTLFKESSLSNSVINSVLSVQEIIWMGTNRGLIKLNLGNSSVKLFDEGLNGIIFNPGSIMKTNSGNIAAGNKSGVVIFNPNILKSDTAKPVIAFSDLKIFSEKKNENFDITRLEKFELSSHQNNLQIDFALMDFNNPGKNQYEYMLEGTDENWISTGNRNFVFYSNLNPGNYELKIRGRNYNGVRSDVQSFKLIISPPFWRTKWFYVLIIFLLAVLTYILYKFRLQKNIRSALAIERVKEEEREKWREQASIDYHDELGHKLTRISMYSRRVLKRMNGSANELGSDINNIIETSNSLRMSARDLIWSLNPSEDSFYDFITRVNLFADELFESSNIKYHKSENPVDWKEIELMMDVKRQMLFILKEGMNNALKYSGAKNVWLYAVKENEKLYMKVVDDGQGFEYPSEYTGYGLLNMQKRAKRAGFDLEIISSPGSGTKIIIYNVVFCSQVNKNF